jgi:hypothetical protein
MKKVYKLKSKVWLYPGMAGWHFITVDKANSAKIKAAHAPKVRRGWGSIRVAAKIGKTEWATSIFPDKGGTYLLPLKAAVRKKEAVFAGDEVPFAIEFI